MSKSTQKAGPSTSSSSTSMSSILSMVSGAFAMPQQPLTKLPPPLLLVGAEMRIGLSAKDIAREIIARQSEGDIAAGDIFANNRNKAEAMEVIRVEAIINAILTQAKVEVVVPPGIPVSTVGVGNFGAPVASQGATTLYQGASGVVR